MIIVTGYTGTPHISSNDEQGKNQGIFGTGNSVLNVGNKFSATLTDVNTVTIADGEGVMQGVHFRVEPGTTDTVSIENGTSGYNRIDLICARYTKNATTGVESVEWAVITGTPNASTPSAPSYNTGDILGGDSPVDFPMFQVTLTGLTPVVTSLFEVQMVPMTLYRSTSTSSIAANGTHGQQIDIRDGVWLITISATVSFSDTNASNSDVIILKNENTNNTFWFESYAYSGQEYVHVQGTTFLARSGNPAFFVVQNNTSRVCELTEFTINGMRIA